jgi:hypothetical protein
MCMTVSHLGAYSSGSEMSRVFVWLSCCLYEHQDTE